ncbi:RNA-binding protein [Companilactobacillus sp. RD055328]|uniref:CvfB family protein n=1 Tax=Companilactobacillus sp. RD055328 TaxID=2916634 RepID=UPI001FC7D415|nr:S1-like domain-containing RNA-binding protein [Companilactobacillus sp. RD055328]GKQ42744.1 RNA-binding protein [Companilactobacillus sp. RD055328]
MTTINYGTTYEGKITDQNNESYFVQVNGITFELDKTEIQDDLINDDLVTGFVYENKEHKNIITTKLPEVQIGMYGKGTVVDVRRDLGVFVDIGLPDKDIVVSLDDLPLDKYEWPKKDDVLMVKIINDNKQRMWAKPADIDLIDQLVRTAPENDKNRFIEGQIIANRLSGSFVLTDDFYLGFIHPSESIGTLRVGQRIKGRTIGTSHYRYNISMKPFAYEEISDDAQMIMTVLEHSQDKKIPYTDKSTPEDIMEYFGISKGSFKKALGNLLKNRYIKQENGFTVLIKEEPKKED